MATVQEPPVAATTIPYVGHVIGLMRNKFDYYLQLSQQTPYPIFTLNLPGQRMYIITKPDLIQVAQKMPKVLAFNPIKAKFAARMCGVSQKAEALVNENVNGDHGDTGMVMESFVLTKAALSSSTEFDEMNRQSLQEITASVNRLTSLTSKTARVKLMMWLRRNLTTASTNSVYGPQNPFKDRSIADAFWDYNSDMMTILFGAFPSLTARKGIAGRTTVAKAFERFYEGEGHKSASRLTKSRYEVAIKHMIPLEDVAKYEVGGTVAILANTIPAAFWMLFFIYSTIGLLDSIRKEIDSIVTVSEDTHGVTRNVDIKSLKQHCPKLISTFQEVLRYCATSVSVRQVMEDTILNGQWLLKKDSLLQMPSRVIHADPENWGIDAQTFNPDRFMKESHSQGVNQYTRKRSAATAFRAFGGGTTLCPGRHFATNEVLAVTAMFALQYDLVPVKGTWSLPNTENTNMTLSIMEPDTDVEVNVSVRKGFEDERFACTLRETDVILAVTAEDPAM